MSRHHSDYGISLEYLLVLLYRQKNRHTDRRKDRQTGGQTDQHVNKLKHFCRREGGGGCGCGVGGRKMHLVKQKGR